MSNNHIIQGVAAPPFKEQFPELSDTDAAMLDEINFAITLLYIQSLITRSAMDSARKKFVALVTKKVVAARKKGGE